ncbi:MAG: site-2 protease family protein [Candidatus Bathyarchaeota archaeon]|nr:MAG: site-2 protease family protein [Candidatus Bathyarchaeota archaeon]
MTESSIPHSKQPVDPKISSQFDHIHSLVAAEFDIEEALIEHGIPTFFVSLKANSKQAFRRLVESLAAIEFTPVLREKDKRTVLKVAPKLKTKPSRPLINIILLLLTIVTVFITGYFLSLGKLEESGLNPFLGAASFAVALLGVLGVHEMAHKFAANHHNMEATMPYFIPGPPFLGIGTFGAVIVQKETAPNRDALFDIGASGPIAGLVVAIVVSAIGLALSPVELITEPIEGALPTSLLFSFLVNAFTRLPGPGNYVIWLHPVAFAGWVGLFVTLLNLLPTGMLDGGHTLRSIVNNDRVRTIFTIVSILALLLTEQWLMLAFVLFLSMYRHPGPLDDISQLSTTRKALSIVLVIAFILCLFMPRQIIGEIFRLLGF